MEDIYDDDYYTLYDDDLEIEDDNICPKRKTLNNKDIPLINEDYNLNSPIMKDIINNIITFNACGTFGTHHKNRTERTWKPFIINKIHCPNLNTIEESYRVIYDYLKLKDIEVDSTLNNFINVVEEEIMKVKPITDKFINSVYLKNVDFSVKNVINNNQTLISLLNKSREISLLLEVMIGKMERVNAKNYNKRYTFKQLNDLIEFKTNFFSGYISEELLLDKNFRILLDKNMLLMMKDIINGRFNTILLTALNLENKYTINFEKLLAELFDKGDTLIRKTGNDGFDAIALLEPLCINHLNKLANKTRPKILNPNTFEKYLNDKISSSGKEECIFLTFVNNMIGDIDNVNDMTILYGSFRLWGHPFIQYEEGLLKVKEQVRMEKPLIDPNYAKLLANDLMKVVMIKNWRKTKSWNVRDTEHNAKIKGISPLLKNTWPTTKEFIELEGHWDELDIEAVLDIPEDLDDSTIFADKTHSLTRSEVERYVKRDNKNPIPTKRVMKTYLEQERVNVKEFVMKIDNEGLSKDDLIIGLKAKERELKKYGRFFTLMTWNLRLYFVISEYMIKKDLIPLFPGLTMSDGFIDLINKILDRTEGQRNDEYQKITYSNHIDYSKWNNHQRDEAVGPVFTVIDKLYGLNNFFRRTHNLFKQCVVYYPERPDYYGKDSAFYWEGQPGGFEGIRQKGWSLVGVLCLMRESNFRNTKVEILAQGDNQVIFTNYDLGKKLTEEEMDKKLEKIYWNNDNIMGRIQRACIKIGLIINNDETVQSSGFTVFGKIPIYKGNILNLMTKKANRAGGVTNDQLPTVANIMSSINSIALTICQHDPTIRQAVYIQLILGIWILNLLKQWTPMIKTGKTPSVLNKFSLLKFLYHDQCLGGNTGMALTRFLIRRFPDPITECLSFYKIYDDPKLDIITRKSFCHMGNPIIKNITTWSFNKLCEDPLSLNIKRGSNIITIIKNQVKISLINHSPNINNKLLKRSLTSVRDQEYYLLTFLKNIKPVFPRFLADFKQASICGFIDNVIGLVQNSKTIRNMFSHEFESKVLKLVTKWELEQWENMLSEQFNIGNYWSCSSSKADELREKSWRTKIIGSTVPHPFEYQNNFVKSIARYVADNHKDIITCIIPNKVVDDLNYHGFNRPYLGSNTRETSSSLQPWEKELTNPVYIKASKLRRGINWIIDSDSMLSQSIYQNLSYVTGLKMEEIMEPIKKHRTGTGQHRYKSSRQDNGGFCNITPNILSWFTVTSDYMSDISDVNYDFMYQASLIYTETIGANIVQLNNTLSSFGMSISCRSCIRPLEDLRLESSMIYRPDLKMKEFWLKTIFKTNVELNLDLLNYSDIITDLHNKDISYYVGIHQGIGFTMYQDQIDTNISVSDLFSIGVMMKLNSEHWCIGLIDGLLIGASYSVTSSETFLVNHHHLSMIYNRCCKLIRHLVNNNSFNAILRLNDINSWMTNISNYIPPSYPPTMANMSRSFLSLGFEILDSELMKYKDVIVKKLYDNMIIYEDFNTDNFKLVLHIGLKVLKSVKSDKFNSNRMKKIRDIFIMYKDYRDDIENTQKRDLLMAEIIDKSSMIRISTKEMKTVVEGNFIDKACEFKEDVYTDDYSFDLNYIIANKYDIINNTTRSNTIECPFISGLRPYRCATGAHYKMNDILNWLDIYPSYVLVGGDGSGGMSSLILRKYINAKIIFNSLMEYNDINTRGGQPGRPQAIMKLPRDYRNRCINLNTAWMEPSDLCESNTWDNFVDILKGFHSDNKLDMIILDMEARTIDKYISIYKNLVSYIKLLMKENFVLITKCYSGMIGTILGIIHENIDNVNVLLINTRFTTSYSTEIYIVIKRGNHFLDLSLIKEKRDITDLVFGFKTDEEEFKRALDINVPYLYSLIPRSLLENYEIYLIGYLIDMDIPSSMSKLFVNLIVSGYINLGMKEIGYYSLIQGGNEQNLISSDSRIKKFLSLLISVLFFESYINQDIEKYKLANLLNNNKVYVRNNKVNMCLKIYTVDKGGPDLKDFEPLRDNSFINLLLRSMIGCNQTIVYQDEESIKNHNPKSYKNNLNKYIN